MARLRFLLDENMQVVIAAQLMNRGIDTSTIRALGELGWDDVQVLITAAQMGYVLCTYDSDYLFLSASGAGHAGIVFGQQERHTIGDWVRRLQSFHARYAAEEFINRVEYL